MGTRIYIGNLTETIKKEELEEEFTKYGLINSVWVAFNPPGFAFIEYANKEDAELAVNSLNGQELFGTKLRVEISKGRRNQGRRDSNNRFGSGGNNRFEGGRNRFGGNGGGRFGGNRNYGGGNFRQGGGGRSFRRNGGGNNGGGNRFRSRSPQGRRF